MGIVLITMQGDSHRAFANRLHRATGQGVDLVIIQKSKFRTPAGRLRRIWTIARSGAFWSELSYGLLLRFSPETQRALTYFARTSIAPEDSGPYEPKTLEVDDINSAESVALLTKLSPDLLMIWRSPILHRPILETAKTVINFHMGLCPYYRGSVANQFAVFKGDREHIGSVIHYVAKEVDRGDIIAQVRADTTKRPREMFRELNDAVLKRYIEIAVKILHGEDIPAERQDRGKGAYYALKQWTNEVRYKVGRRLVEWERTGKF